MPIKLNIVIQAVKSDLNDTEVELNMTQKHVARSVDIQMRFRTNFLCF